MVNERRMSTEVTGMQTENTKATEEETKNGIYVLSSGNLEKSPRQKTSFFHIDRPMLRFKLHYFLYTGAMGLILPYMPILANTRVGLSGTAVGVLFSTQRFLFLFTTPLSGYLVDYFKILKSIICTFIFIIGIFFSILLLTPPIEKENDEKNRTILNSCIIKQLDDMEIVSRLCVKISSSDRNFTNLVGGYGSSTLETICLPDIVHYFQSNSSMVYCKKQFNEKTESDKIIKKMQLKSLGYTEKNATEVAHFCCRSENGSHLMVCYCQNRILNLTVVNDFNTYQFWLFATIHTIAMGCVNSLYSLSDTAMWETIKKTGSDFGRQRLYAAVSWGLMSALAGLLYDYTNDYVPTFALMGIMCLLTFWNMYKIDLVTPQFSKNILKDVGSVFKSRDFMFFDVGMLLCGIGTSIAWVYQNMFYLHLRASRFLCGLGQVVQSFLGGIPFMFFSGSVLEKLGHFNVVSLALFGYTVRFLCYSWVSNPWLVLPVEVVHGLTYGLLYPAMASYAKISAKPGTEATTQAVVFTTYEGLGAGLGCFLFGAGYEYFGWEQMFFYLSMVMGFGMILMIIFTIIVRSTTTDKTKY